jgi:hypothetical protein
LKEIRPEAFGFCINLTTISLPASVSVDLVESFSGCRLLESVVFEDGHGVPVFDQHAISGIDLCGAGSPFPVLRLLRATNFHEYRASRRRFIAPIIP